MSSEPKAARENPILWAYRVVQGALIGGGAILPGVSGGVLAVVFGVYRSLMAFFARPFQELKAQWRLFVPLIVGVALGFWGFAKLVDWMFSGASPVPLALFIGLILGTVPMLYRAAQKPKNGQLLTAEEKRSNWAALVGAFALLLALLLLMSGTAAQDLQPTIPLSLLSGVVWGFSLVVPGLSSSSILLFIGIYTKLMAAVKDLDFMVIVPLLLGIAAVAFLLARFIDRLFDRHHGVASNAVIGLVLASTLALVIAPPPEYRIVNIWQGMLCLAVAAAGFAGAHWLAKWGEKIKPEGKQ
jgi:putative membrane protein